MEQTVVLKHLLGLLRTTTGSLRVFGLDPVLDPVGVLSRVGYTQAFHPTWMRRMRENCSSRSGWTRPRRSRSSRRACGLRPASSPP